MNKVELEKYRSEQDVKKAAEVKAKLDMVETRRKTSYNRLPRKIGEMVCSTGVKNGYHDERVKFVLRLDADAGDFIAEHGDVLYVSRSREALKTKMDEVARVTLHLKWSRYLLVEYRTTVPYESDFNSTTTLDVDAKRRADQVVFGISLRWEIVEYSDAIHLPSVGERFMKRDVDDDGEPSSVQETVIELPSGLVPYTPERERTLRRIREVLTDVDARMVKLFQGTPHAVARQLDAVNGATLLLEAPKKTKS